MAKKVWNKAGALGAVNWAVKIANDNSFTYGPKPATSRCGCYFCGTNGGKVKINGGKKHYYYNGKKFDIRKTYVCCTFISAAYAHGANDPTMLKLCKARDLPITENNKNFKGARGKCWMLVARGSKMRNAKLMPGDVIIRYNESNSSPGHVCMYAGNDKLVEAVGGSGSPRSILVHKGAKNRVRSYASGNNYIMRYCGRGNGNGTTASLGGSSSSSSAATYKSVKTLKLKMFYDALELAAKQFYEKNTTYKSKCDSTAGKIRKTVNSSGFISQGLYNFMKSIESSKSYPKGSSFSMGSEFTSCKVFEKHKDTYTMTTLDKSPKDAVKDGDVQRGDICGFEKNGKEFVMVYAGKSKKGDLLWYSYGGAGKKKNKGVKEWKNAENPRKRGDYGNVKTVVRINGIDGYFVKMAEGSSSSGSGGSPSSVSITGFYEFYSGQDNSQVISFSPQIEDISSAGGDWLVTDANSIDAIRNEIISFNLGSKYKQSDVMTDGQNRIMGKSSSSMESLSLKATSMWEKNFSRQYTATMEVMGDTGVRTGTWIYVDVYTKYGLRHHSSGIYYVEEAEDNISDGSFTTSLQLRKHGTYEQYQQSMATEDENQGGIGSTSDDGDEFPTVNAAGINGMIEWAEKIAKNDNWIYKSNNATCPLCHPKGQSKPQGWVCTTFCRGAINHGMFKESNKYWKDKDQSGAGGLVGGSGSGDFEAMLKNGGFKRVNGKAKKGDIIVRPNQHAMIYKGKNKIIHAAGKAKGILEANVYFSWSSVRLYRYGG